MREAYAACRPQLTAAAGFSALINLLYLAPTIYMMQIYDRVVPTGGIGTLIWLTIVLGLALATLTALDNVRARLMALTSLKLNDELSGKILARLISARSSATTGQAMREFDVLRQTLTGPATTALFDAPWTPIYFIVAFLIHPLLGVMILVGGIILVVLAVLNERNSRARGLEAMRANAIAYGAQETLHSQAEHVRAQGIRKAMVARLQAARAQGLMATAQTLSAGLKYNSLIKFARMFMQSLALGLGAVLAINGLISAGTIIGASVLLSRALQPVEQLVGSWGQIVASRQALESLRSLLEGVDGEAREYHPLPEPTGHIQASGITLQLPEEGGFILNNVGLELKPGQACGLIGPSGAGKSTLARIIAGAIQPHAGEVRLDSAHYDDWEPDELARHLGYMPQDNALFPGTIAENISRFAALRGEDIETVGERVIEAAKLAGVHQMILHFPGGYAAKIGDPSFGLSGGQRQRIALARALYGSPKVLVLDEPNSALDTDGEKALLGAIEQAKVRGAAILLVAHQVQILNAADTLVVMRSGTVERHGPTRQVIAELREEATRNNVLAMKREGGAANV